MKIIRLQFARFFILISVIIVFFFIVVYKNSSHNFNCTTSKSELYKIYDLLDKVQHPLNELKIAYFVCYNSLWGALKFNAPLPWQNDLELCILNKEVSAIDEGFLIRTFKRHNLEIGYNSAGGYYKVIQKDEHVSQPTATLTVFEEDIVTNQMRRVGWTHRVLPPTSCEELHCFPPELIVQPLPSILFGTRYVPVPRDGIEIQKYLFPYTWWKELTPPPNCVQNLSNGNNFP